MCFCVVFEVYLPLVELAAVVRIVEYKNRRKVAVSIENEL
jgi:hypothetical protein